MESSFVLSKDTSLHIGLLETTSHLKFRIYSGDKALNLAEVKVEDSQKFTNAVGIALYEDLPRFKEYAYSIEKEGYLTESGMVSLHGDTSLNVNMQIISSMDGFAAESIRLYPNPVHNELILESAKPLNRIELFTLSGKLIHTYHAEKQATSLDLSEQGPGTYLLKIYPEDNIPVMKRVIVSK